MARSHYGWLIVAVSVAAVVGALGFGRFGYTMILPSMAEGLGLGEVQAADLAAGNMAGYLLVSVVAGVLAARLGSRRVVSVGMAVTAAAMLLTGLARGYPLALSARILTGMGSGGVNVPIMALVAVWFAPSRRGAATGLTVGGSSIGLLVTGLLVPWALRRAGPEGWRLAWVLLAAVTAATGLACALLLRNAPGDLGLAPCGSEGGRSVPTARVGSSPLQWGLVFKSRRVWHLAGVYLTFGFSYVIYATFFVRYLTSEGHFDIGGAGSLWAAVGSVSMASGLIWGSISDRLGRKHGLALVFFLQMLSYAAFGLWRRPAGAYLSAGLFALTAWSIPAIMVAALGDLLEPRLAPAAYGFVSLFLGLGQALGPFVAGRVAALTQTYARAFLLAAAAALLGAAGSLLLPAGRGAGDAAGAAAGAG